MREKLIELISQAQDCGCDVTDVVEMNYVENDALADHLIANDVVPVVRCKDCIHYDFGVCLKIYSDGAVSQYAWQARKEDDFCSYGERRTDEI